MFLSQPLFLSSIDSMRLNCLRTLDNNQLQISASLQDLQYQIPVVPAQFNLIEQIQKAKLTNALMWASQYNNQISDKSFPEVHFPFKGVEMFKETPIESPESVLSDKPSFTKASFSTNRASQVKIMLEFFLYKFIKAEKHQVEAERRKYLFDRNLLSLFDCLSERYTTVSKCKEDMIRLVIRKSLSFQKDSLRKSMKVNSKRAATTLCQKYFEEAADNKEEAANVFLPYKKSSKNKTANNCFISEIFSSEAFCQDYKKYLEKFDEIFEDDNQKKVQRFTDFLLACMKDGNLETKILGYKRLPWLQSWLDASKVIAFELLNAHSLKNISKKVKI